jgi:hypothetical protein
MLCDLHRVPSCIYDPSSRRFGDSFGAVARTQFGEQRRQMDAKFIRRHTETVANLANSFALCDQLKGLPLSGCNL